MTFFPQNFEMGVSKLGLLLSQNYRHSYLPQNQACLEHARAISYSSQKDISNGVLHAPIRAHVTLALKGFVVGSQILNLIFDLFLYIIIHAFQV